MDQRPMNHGKRSDKETQSPMLKIFKDMMQKDKRDPEKTNLLKEKHHERKRKHYSGSRTKSVRLPPAELPTEAMETVYFPGIKCQTPSSSSEHAKNDPYKMIQQEARNAEIGGGASKHTLPFQKEKRESWWFWDSAEPKKPAGDDSCSCVSCALKRLISTDYACIFCIVLLLAISIIIAVMLVYKSIPCSSADRRFNTEKVLNQKMENERLKRKIENLGKWSYGPQKHWRNIFKKPDEPDLFGMNFHGNEVSNLVDSENDLSKILDSEKLNEIQHSDRLRDFYKKLIQTDAAIRNLRKSLTENSYTSDNNLDNNFGLHNNVDTNNNYDINSNTNNNNKVEPGTIDADRLKRSPKFRPGRLFHFKRREPVTHSKINNGKLITQSTINMTSNKKPNDVKTIRSKRFGNFTNEGLIIEKNKVLIQYKPSRLVPKCSHAPKDSKSHEKAHSHPFYKNTQRLDELLDQFIDKKLPDLLADGFELDVLFDKNKKCKHPLKEAVILVKDDDMIKDYELRSDDNQKDNEIQKAEDNQNNNDKTEEPNNNKDSKTTVKAFVIEKSPKVTQDVKHSANVFENEFFEDSDGVDKNVAVSTTGRYDIILSVSTLVNAADKRTTSKMTTPERANLRKLLQVNMKTEDGVTYEDLKEVLADYNEGPGDDEAETDRKKRHDDSTQGPHYPQGVHNPNWKGPMPLYPDELTQMAMKNPSPSNKVPVHNRDMSPEIDEAEPSETDVEYVEDYLHNGYERLVELAQAYSDYGVLDEKKDAGADKKSTDLSHKLENMREGTSIKRRRTNCKRGLKNSRLFGKSKQGRDSSEGIRIEIQPTMKSPSEEFKFKKIFNKHVKLSGTPEADQLKKYSVPETSAQQMPLNYINLPITTNTKPNKDFDPNHNIVFKKRMLKAESANLKNVTDLSDEEIANTDTSKIVQINNEKIHNKNRKDPNKLVNKESGQETKQSSDSEEKDNAPKQYDKLKLKRAHVPPKRHNNYRRENENSSKLNKNENTALSSFLMTLSKMFSYYDTEEKKLTKHSPSHKNTKLKKQDSESPLAFPAYDSEMVDNIGHRSRMLMSVEVANNTEKIEDPKTEVNKQTMDEVTISTEPMNKANSTRSIQETTETILSKNTITENKNRKIRRKRKRQAIDDSNLIFWNDLYDEEYGVNADPIENNIRDKHSAEKGDILKRSNTWIQDKVKKITEKFSLGGSTKKIVKEKMINEGTKHVKRNANYDGYYDNNAAKIDFGALTERMKQVCKETVKAVQDSKHIQVRDDSKETQAATSLMQQLVRLMTDLVDFQVQERTCRKLPPDLQTFLEWLTSSKEDGSDSNYYREEDDNVRYTTGLSSKFDTPTEQPTERIDRNFAQPTTEPDSGESKTDCLSTLQAVQSLIREYEEMSEDDKSVMTGIKHYLENQMHFLQQQLPSDDKYSDQGPRYRRHIFHEIGHTVADRIEGTAHHLKDMCNKIRGKIGLGNKENVKHNEEVDKTVSEVVNKLTTPEAVAKKPKPQFIPPKTVKITDKVELTKKEKSHKNRKHKHRSLSKFCLKNRGNSKNKDLFGTNTDQAYSGNERNAKNDNVKDVRNVKVINFKTEEATKSIAKDVHERDSDTFDKTDIFRINDFVGEKDN